MMIKKLKTSISVAAAILCGGFGVAQADEMSYATSDWSFAAAPYLWAAGLEGSTGVFGLPAQDIDLSFGDIWDNLDMAFMAVGEARNGRMTFGLDFTYVRISTDINTPFGILANSIDAEVTAMMGTFYGGYSVFYQDNATVDIIGGGRVWSVDNDFGLRGGLLDGRKASDGDTWVDPLIGAKFRTDINDRVYLTGWAMVGGFGLSSDNMWDVMGAVGYKFNDLFSVVVGYRGFGVDYSEDGFVYDVTQKGPVIGGVFKF